MQIFNAFSINLHPTFLQLNSNSTQLNLNLIVELNFVKLKLHYTFFFVVPTRCPTQVSQNKMPTCEVNTKRLLPSLLVKHT